MLFACYRSIGTSPRARGKPRPGPPCRSDQRNIPACAGKTIPRSIWYVTGEEHPRVRGENIYTFSHGLLQIGTSPRARGKLSPALSFADDPRNIPACAGKTVSVINGTLDWQEHPRVRGEN